VAEQRRDRERGGDRRGGYDRGFQRGPKMDDDVKAWIDKAERDLIDSLSYFEIPDMNPFQRKQIYRHFEKTNEYAVKAYRNEETVTLRIYAVGALRRLAEQQTQEVLMSGRAVHLPIMGSFERFVVHDYLKDREGVNTESAGERGEDRHIVISPLFGRSLKKAKKKRLMR